MGLALARPYIQKFISPLPSTRTHTSLTHAFTGLTSSVDSLFNTIFHTGLSEYSPVPAREANVSTQAPVSDQSLHKIQCIQIQSPATSCAGTGEQPIPLYDSSHQEQVEDRTSDTIDHSEAKSERSLTDSSPQTSIAGDTNVQARSSFDTHNQTLTLPDHSHQDHSTKEQIVAISGQTAAVNMPTVVSDPYQIMLCHSDKLTTALSLDPMGIAEILSAKGLIPEITKAQMQQYSTPREKAIILVTTVTQRIESAPKLFQEFLDILSQQTWTKDIMKVLQSCVSLTQLNGTRKKGASSGAVGPLSVRLNQDSLEGGDAGSTSTFKERGKYFSPCCVCDIQLSYIIILGIKFCLLVYPGAKCYMYVGELNYRIVSLPCIVRVYME